ncbi:MAG: SDR family NAD(P)-dependent oxidoreductase [Polyangiaceae bacterium]
MALPASPKVVITGASSGFGRALAIELASSKRARLVLSDVDMTGVAETARLVKEAGATSADVVKCDVTKLADVEALEKTIDGDVDLLVNNAGVSSAGRIGELSIEDWKWTVDVDLWGVIYGCHVFVPRFRKQRHGHVLNVASAAGIVSAPTMGAYNVAKAGVISLSETLLAEVKGAGIGVTVLCPTFFQTNIATSGRFASPEKREMAEKLVARGKKADGVAKAAIASVERNELYCVPMADGRWLWRLKRVAPQAFGSLVARASKRLEG